jgi:hypothetical protein
VAGLIDIDVLREMFSISSDIVDGRLGGPLGAASRRLRVWVGSDVYEDATALTPLDADRAAELKVAEANLAMHFALLGLNTQLRSSGVVKTERVEGDTVINYLSPVEIKQLTDQYLNQAEEIVRPYAIDDSIDAVALRKIGE